MESILYYIPNKQCMEGGVFKGLHLRLWRAKNVLLYVAVWAQTGLVGGGGAGGGWVGLMVCLYLHLMGRVTWTLHVSTPGSMFVSTHTHRPVFGGKGLFFKHFLWEDLWDRWGLWPAWSTPAWAEFAGDERFHPLKALGGKNRRK